MRSFMKTVTVVALSLAVSVAVDGSALAALCGFDPFPPCEGVPEIDPNLLRGAVAVLAGGVLMLAGRRRRS